MLNQIVRLSDTKNIEKETRKHTLISDTKGKCSADYTLSYQTIIMKHWMWYVEKAPISSFEMESYSRIKTCCFGGTTPKAAPIAS